MSVRSLAKRWLPPAVADAMRRLRDSGDRAEYEFALGGWRAQGRTIRGWNVESVARAQREAWPRFVESIHGPSPLGVAHEAVTTSGGDIGAHNTIMAFGYVLALASRNRERVSILDWGGGMGHYYALGRALVPDVAMDYHCRDLPALCREGRSLFPEVHFYDDDRECFGRSYDLVLSSSSLQYIEDWRKTASRLAGATSSYLFVTRLPIVHHEASFVVVQRAHRYGYGTEYLGWHLNRQEFLDHMERERMSLVREFLIQEMPHVRRAPEQGEQRGFLFRPAGGAPAA